MAWRQLLIPLDSTAKAFLECQFANSLFRTCLSGGCGVVTLAFLGPLTGAVCLVT